MDTVTKDAGAIPDKEQVQVEGQGATTSAGEYREAVVGYMKQLNPDLEIDDNNYTPTLEKTVAEHVIPRMKAYDEANTNLRAMIHGDQKLGKILADMSRGAKFEEVLPRYYDPKDLVMQEGDPDYLKWEANNSQRKADYQASLDRETQMENNRAKAEETILKWFEDKAMADDDKKEYGAFVAETLDRAYAGEITPEFLNKMYYAMKYQDDVKQAEEIGTIKGRNAKIVNEKMEEDKKLAGDGLPAIDGGVAREEKERLDEPANPLIANLRMRNQKKSVIPGNY